MARWRWFAYRLVDLELLGELTMSSWSHTDTLNDSGEWSATLAPPATRDQAATIRAATAAGRTAIVAVRDDLPMFAGIVWSRLLPSLAGSGLMSYLDRRLLLHPQDFAAVDQHTIVADLIGWQQANGGIPIEVVAGVSAQLRDLTLQPWDQAYVGEQIRKIAESEAGSDFAVGPVLVDGAMRWRCSLWYPRRGRPSAESLLRFEAGANCDLSPLDEQAAELATRVTGFGAETNSTTQERRTVTRDRTEMTAAGWPVLDSVLDVAEVRHLGTLRSMVNGALRRIGRVDAGSMSFPVIPDHEIAPIGTWQLGDDCTVIVPAGVDPWWPQGRRSVNRVLSTSWTVAGASEQLTVSVGARWTPT